MSEPELNEQESSELEALSGQPLGVRLKYYAKRTGPGWLQAAITLGGGSLAGALFLGVMMGYNLMWLQPLAMILGVVMLSAIAYVTLATGKRPFAAINEHVSPVLGWAWLIAAMMANIVWCLPQFALGTGAVQQNLVPSLENVAAAPWLIGLVLLAAAALVVRAYDSDSKGVKIFETILKTMVGIVVVSFFLVVVRLTMMGDLKWGEILAGFIPSISDIRNPAPAIETAIAATGDQSAAIWRDSVSSVQKSKVIAAFGTAVGINMTFLLPYSMLRKGWGKNHRGLAIFDLGSGLVIPFVIATACIVIAAASQFHAKTSDVLNDDGTIIAGKEASFAGVADKFISTRYAVELDGLEGEALGTKVTELRDALPLEDRMMAAMLVDRKDSDLAKSLSSLAGPGVGKIIFGIGVLGMALSTIIILMLINGFCLCEAMGRPGDKKLHFLGSLIPGFLGLCFPLIWTAESKAALAVPTSVIGSSLLPIAYFIFLLMMNSKKLLGNAMPTGGSRVVWNVLMFIATGLATFGSIWALKDKNLGAFPMGKVGIGVLVILFVIGIIGFISKNKKDAS